jgi:hypothetical protein
MIIYIEKKSPIESMLKYKNEKKKVYWSNE